MSGPGSRKYTHAQTGQCRTRYVMVLRSRTLRVAAYSTREP